MSYRGLKIREKRTHVHTLRTRTYIKTPEKITFLDALDYSEYSEINISKFFPRKDSFFSKEAIYYKEIPQFRIVLMKRQ